MTKFNEVSISARNNVYCQTLRKKFLLSQNKIFRPKVKLKNIKLKHKMLQHDECDGSIKRIIELYKTFLTKTHLLFFKSQLCMNNSAINRNN